MSATLFWPITRAEISRGADFGFESVQTYGFELLLELLLLLLEFEFEFELELEFELLDEFCGAGAGVGVGVGVGVGISVGIETTGLVIGAGSTVGVGVGVSVTTGLVIGEVIGFANTLSDIHFSCMMESRTKLRIASE